MLRRAAEVAVHEHDALSRLTATTDPAGATWMREYDASGNLIGSVDPVGTHHVDRLTDVVDAKDARVVRDCGDRTQRAAQAVGGRPGTAQHRALTAARDGLQSERYRLHRAPGGYSPSRRAGPSTRA